MTSLHLPAAVKACPARPPVTGSIEAVFLRHRHRLPWLHAAMFVAFVLLLFVPPLMPLPAEQDGAPFCAFEHYKEWVRTSIETLRGG